MCFHNSYLIFATLPNGDFHFFRILTLFSSPRFRLVMDLVSQIVIFEIPIVGYLTKSRAILVISFSTFWVSFSISFFLRSPPRECKTKLLSFQGSGCENNPRSTNPLNPNHQALKNLQSSISDQQVWGIIRGITAPTWSRVKTMSS